MSSDRFELDDAGRNQRPAPTATNVRVSEGTMTASFWLAPRRLDIQHAALEVAVTRIENRTYYSADRLRQDFGADPATAQTVKYFARRHGLKLVAGPDNSRLIAMQVDPSQVRDLFGLELRTESDNNGSYRWPTGNISLPLADFPESALRHNILAVFGLNTGLQSHPCSRSIPIRLNPAFNAGAQSNACYPPPAYGFPTRSTERSKSSAASTAMQTPTGKGQTVGIIAFGGTLTAADLARFAPTPWQISVVSFQAEGSMRTDPNFARETTMDVAIAFQCAPEIEVIVFLLDGTEQGWITGLSGILDLDPIPSVLSISWGWPETSERGKTGLWTPAAILAVEDLLAALALRGVTTVVASGDEGWNIWYPGSSAFVLSCGATLDPGPRERVWRCKSAASGGGISSLIPMPDWQANSGIVCSAAGLPTEPRGKRCLPDVASWAVYPHNALQGTSVAAPMWAALIAIANEHLANHKMPLAGNVNALLYDPQSGLQAALNDVTIGNNSTAGGCKPFYRASPGWNACTGWGSPNATKFIHALAGTSQFLRERV